MSLRPIDHYACSIILAKSLSALRIIYNRLELAIDAHSGLALNQYGFTKRRSTIDAVNLVVGTAKRAISGERWKGGAKKYCAIIALDVTNAFNLAQWDIIWKVLKTFNVLLYIRKIVSDYFTNRILMYDTEIGA